MSQHTTSAHSDVPLRPADKDFASQVKVWLFPTIITILGTLIWNSMQSLQADVKQLLVQNSADQVRISKLEADMSTVMSFVFGHSTAVKRSETPLPTTVVKE